MAQIIRHRRGALESVQGTTKRAGEFIIATGSSGITSTNNNGIAFIGIDGSTVTPTNKILFGTSVPNLNTATYDSSVDGIPFYDSDNEQLFILRGDAANIEVKTTPNTGGTGIVSSSAQLEGVFLEINGDNVISSSAQLEGVFLEINGDNVISGSSQVDHDATTNFVANEHINHSSVSITAGSGLTGGGDITTTRTINVGSGTGITVNADDIEVDNTVVPFKNGDNLVSQSLLNTLTNGEVTQLANINTETISNTQWSYLGTLDQSVSSSADVTFNQVSAPNIGTSDGSTVFTGSFVGDASGLTGIGSDLAFSGSDGTNGNILLTSEAITFGGGTGVSSTVSGNTVTYSVQDATTSVKGIASFNTANFAVSSGDVTIKTDGVGSTEIAANAVGTSEISTAIAGTGLSGGGGSALSVDYGSSAGTAVEGNTSLTIQGTTNEVEVTSGVVTLGSGGTVTVGLPNDVTIGNDLTVTNDLGVSGNATITGNLSVLGTTTTIDSTTVQIGDNIIELNYGGAASTSGLLVTDATGGSTVSGSLLFNATTDVWTAGLQGSEKTIALVDSSLTNNTVVKADSNGLLVDSVLSDDGTDATFSGDVIVSGLSSGNAFLFADASKTLSAVAASTDGDLIQWNGSSFVASNTIDGGTF